jgi:N-methylhydantoinase A/oxoprolinase/acetone carboxylase beta subunit
MSTWNATRAPVGGLKEGMTMRTQYRLGIDAGGTFTDFVVADHRSGDVRLFKALSTPVRSDEGHRERVEADRR